MSTEPERVQARSPDDVDAARDGRRDVSIELADRGTYLHLDLVDPDDRELGRDEANLDLAAARRLRDLLTGWIDRRDGDATYARLRRLGDDLVRRQATCHERVACPACGAEAGDRCRHLGRTLIPLAHSHRDRLAADGIPVR